MKYYVNTIYEILEKENLNYDDQRQNKSCLCPGSGEEDWLQREMRGFF